MIDCLKVLAVWYAIYYSAVAVGILFDAFIRAD
jgi:hypothetical protein